MPDLSRDLRRALASTIEHAREAAEAGAGEALRRLGVFDIRRPARLDDARNETRKRLRAHAKSLGDRLDGADGEPLRRLTEAAAYVQWHRLLFARFLLERWLLRDEAGVALSLSDCREEAALEGNGDEWSFASTYAAKMLPGVFPTDDPVEALVLAPEHAKALRGHLFKLDETIFQADDSLGWTYQFWREAEKKEINDSQRKIGAAELPAVTQLFTEPYMVRFLLHNTLGAWWAGKLLAGRPDLVRDAVDEDALRAACGLPGYAWDFLRFVKVDETWRPAAGVFPGWPTAAAGLTVLDPCCGSGHFLTEALAALAALRAAHEALAPTDAVVAVLRDNLAGLEIDERCVQIAAFALAMTAWRIGGPGLTLPTPHVACVGGPPPLPKVEFVALANGDGELRRGLDALYDLFAQAPLHGSLIKPVDGDLIDPTRVARIENSIFVLVEKMRCAEPDRMEGALAARGLADAAAILARRWVLQATNVPYLGKARTSPELSDFLSRQYQNGQADLATAMLERMADLAERGGTIASVSKQEWCFLGSYRDFRKSLLKRTKLDFVVALGEEAWETFGKRGPLATLAAWTNSGCSDRSTHFVMDSTDTESREVKIARLTADAPNIVLQTDQITNPDSRIATKVVSRGTLLSRYANSFQGAITGDSDFMCRVFWEKAIIDAEWRLFASTCKEKEHFSGYSRIVNWKNDGARLARRQGLAAFGKLGVAVSQFRELGVSFYLGTSFDNNIAAIIPHCESHLAAIWSFCSSEGYSRAVRKIDGKKNVTNATLVKVPFDLSYWEEFAAKHYPDGLPDPYSGDPTQWLFHGHPRYALPGTELHVALARMSGYRWPAETDAAISLSTEGRAYVAEAATLPPPDADGLLALVPVLGERPLADRLRAFCVTAWGDVWTPNTEPALVAASCDRANEKPPRQLTLDAWLRTHAARQHAKLFHDHPFLWWITDGRADGFTVVAHYHRLTRGNLERLAYTVLGDWIARLGGDPRTEAACVLQAKLALIREGEAPYDIFVRWKPLHAQPLGWDPVLDDGVRMNIRPFIEAGVLAHEPNVKYGTDRGKDVSSAPWHHLFNGERRNDHHTTLAEKQTALAEQAAKRPVPA